MKKVWKIIDTDHLYIGLILLIAVLTRCVGFGIYPGGVHVDEAFSGYEAWSMLNYGTDSWGYHNPVYLTAWGSGMNVMNSLLIIPFIRIWGLSEITIRMPQVLIGLISVYIFYLLLLRVENKNTALLGSFFLAVSPWHIMMSRWGLESNLAPGFLLISAYFFVKGLDRERYLILSAFFFGVSLYCYAATWILVPAELLIWGIYCMKWKRIKVSRYLFMSVILLFVLAFPLILFVLVNMGIIPEIRTGFISIPRMLYFRSDELSAGNWLHYGKRLLHLIIFQEDGSIWNAIPWFGLYYLISTPFIFAGGAIYVSKLITNIKNRRFGYEVLILSWLVVGLGTVVMQGVSVHKMNCCHIPVIILWTKGAACLLERFKKLAKPLLAVYFCCLIIFMGCYFTTFQRQISERQLQGSGKAIQAAEELFKSDIYEAVCLTPELRHSRVLFYTQFPTDKYREQVKWQNYPSKFLNTKSFGIFEWDDNKEDPYNEQKIYILPVSEAEEYVQKGWNVDTYDYVCVAYK